MDDSVVLLDEGKEGVLHRGANDGGVGTVGFFGVGANVVGGDIPELNHAAQGEYGFSFGPTLNRKRRRWHSL